MKVMDFKLMQEVERQDSIFVVTGLTIDGVFIHKKNKEGSYRMNESVVVYPDRLFTLKAPAKKKTKK